MTTTPFKNEPFVDFSLPQNDKAMRDALAKVKNELGKSYPLIINGEAVFTNETEPSYNPANKEQIIGTVSQADQKLVDQAMEAATQAFKTWRYTSAEVRSSYLLKASAAVRRRKFEFSAWMVYETGKSFAEADADVAEAIDFMEYYAREMLRIDIPVPLVPYEGELNRQIYIPLGVGIVIPPWNFPLAIMAGMATSAIVAGNTILLKPSPNAPIIAAKFVELMQELGLPKGVLNYVPGRPETIGDYMTGHVDTRFISFTGSRDVGLHIVEHANKRIPGQKWIKRVIAEMGGKDGIVVDSDADLDAAATAIVQSSFGFQGQKCSAASRAIIHKDVYDTVVEKVVQLTKALKMGNPEDNAYVGPVIDDKSFAKVQRYIEIGKTEAKLATGGELGPDYGYFIQPTIFIDAKADSRLMQEEIFGPVLGMMKADSFEEAIDIFNSTDYGLTGSVFSQNEEHLAYASERMFCGNLYFNRKCTGALVGVHPFGGFSMSGTDSKTGGPDYLQLFMQAKLVSEKF
ncbi:MAG: L-glutamate gamma-semialdehyde dehydrogenase [Acidibacillus sp.]|uniref:L-glutamate gamma-semialdehyde dehydrogenase n=1 Tax=Sulfoacidibacillus ferrooxidans TaxID=2005001 RepID=A0A9X1V8E0_9BACL|nr:L-glutamate gamma-semialdehyde dehydrogenase [Sulfoacidibacillus ferrooxidans]MCI0183017.1 1-pyrroline-5-carboxylate dehydrogenase 1 [Sulfoacidibacillus ferrooxidans]MCY0892640.1 L-glutamate gamma-semialdehyde dehydrogenase [Acidibacillus sp.]